MSKTKFSSHKQYPFGLLFSRNTKKAHAHQSYTTCRKPLKVAAAKSLSQVYTSLIQLASANVFYSM